MDLVIELDNAGRIWVSPVDGIAREEAWLQDPDDTPEDLRASGLCLLEEKYTAVSVNSFLDTCGPKIRLPQLRHNVAHVSPGLELCIHAVQSATSHCIDAETRAALGEALPQYQRF